MPPIIAIDHADGTRTCNLCGKRQKLEKYGIAVRSAKGRINMCNRCRYVKYCRPSNMKKVLEIRQFKMDSGCADCGYTAHHAALQFDHRPGTTKVFTIGEKVSAYSLAKIYAEIAKCDVVCANCHFIRTFTRVSEKMDVPRARS